MIKDEQFLARNMFEDIDVKGIGKLKMPGIIPKLSETPGSTEWAGPELGEHNEEVIRQFAGLSEEQYQKLVELGIV